MWGASNWFVIRGSDRGFWAFDENRKDVATIEVRFAEPAGSGAAESEVTLGAAGRKAPTFVEVPASRVLADLP